MNVLKEFYNKILAWRKKSRLARLARLAQSLEYDGSETTLEEGIRKSRALDEARRQYIREKFPNFKG